MFEELLPAADTTLRINIKIVQIMERNRAGLDGLIYFDFSGY